MCIDVFKFFFHNSVIKSVIFLERTVFRKFSLINEQASVSFSNALGVANIFGGSNIAKFISNDNIMGSRNCVSHHFLIMIHKYYGRLTFSLAAPVKLNLGNV